MGDPRLHDVLSGLAILAGSYVAARLASVLLGKALSRWVARTSTRLDDRLVKAFKGPVTYLLFLWGALVAAERFPIPARWGQRVSMTLFVLGALLVTLALLRAWRAVVGWYLTESQQAQEGVAAEFGPLLGKLGTGFILLVVLIAVFEHLGVDMASLLVSLGVGSAAVGFAAKDTLANMFAGFTLLLDRPFKIGERIQLASGEVGDVEAIGMRATRIRTLDQTLLVIPNSVLVTERVVNQSRPGRHVTTRIDVGVAYGTDLARARAILIEAALASEQVDPQFTPVAVVTRFGDFAVQLRLVFWARDYADQSLAVSQVHEEIDRRFREAGIEIPFPLRVLQEAS